jgi:hypothetical protein
MILGLALGLTKVSRHLIRGHRAALARAISTTRLLSSLNLIWKHEVRGYCRVNNPLRLVRTTYAHHTFNILSHDKTLSSTATTTILETITSSLIASHIMQSFLELGFKV